MFILLTLKQIHSLTSVNTAHIVRMSEDKNFTRLWLSDGSLIEVMESIEDIANASKPKKK